MRKKTRIAVFAAAVLAVAAMCVAGCNGSAQEGDSQDITQATEVSYAPKVRQLEDGTIIQLTPYDDRSNAYYFQQRDFVPYNTYWVHADERGCKSCHDNLRELLQDMDQYNHGGVDTILEGVEWDINTCIDCHTIGAWYYFVTNYEKLSTLIHAQHQDVASCWNCHDTQEDYATGTTKMVLWENVKYEKLRGIYTLTADEMTGDFTYTQDYITPVKDMYNLGPEYSDADRERYQKHEDGVPLDQELYDNWSITVDGTAVAEPKTFMLKDIMENGPIQTITCTFNCATARVNAGAVGQFEVTGVPLSWVFDQCDISEDAALCCGVSVDYFGYDTATEYPTVYEMGMLATEINGEPLSWAAGYPVLFVRPGFEFGWQMKQVSLITVDTLEGFTVVSEFSEGGMTETPIWEPYMGFMNIQEGQVIKTGEPFTIRGYADYMTMEPGGAVTAVEISMDHGATWKTFEIPDSDPMQWVVWEYTFTPEYDGAYCFMIRAQVDTGAEQTIRCERMIIANSDPESLL